MASFLTNVWYVAGWSHELAPGHCLARTVAGIPMVMFRDDIGSGTALLDRCPHRFAPLSLGKLDGRGIRCGYHGILYGADGRCLENPHGGINSALTVRRFVLLERHKLMWIWMGEVGHEDPALIPDLRFLDEAPAVSFISGYLPTAADHTLMVDNILDLTHADYLHPDSLGGGSMTRSTPRTEALANHGLRVSWTANDEAPLPIMRNNYPEPDARIDMFTRVDWWPNGVMVLVTGGKRTREPADVGTEVRATHIMTPEIPGRTHYFYSNTRNFEVENAHVTRGIEAALRHAFEHEDKPMIEAQQRRIGAADLLDLQPALQKSDAASTQARRIFRKLLAEQPLE